MRIACFWGEARSLDRISFRHEHLIDGFAALGHDAVLVTARPWRGGFHGPTHLVDALDELERPELWRRLGFDVAVGLTWLRKSRLLAALAAAGLPRLAIADSDGQIGYSAHPAISWARIWPYQRSARDRLRAALYFARRYLASRSGRDPEEREFVASARASSAIAFGSDPAIDRFRRFLVLQGESALADRAFVAPFPVPDAFCRAPLQAKEDRVVAVGRWSDPQKDAPLLAATLAHFLARRSTTAIDIFGADGEPAFAALAARFPRIEVRGVQEPQMVQRAFARSRALVVSSRWETGPHAAGEALALGTTLVSPPLPTVEGLIDGGRFGTLAADRGSRSLAEALAAEMSHWDEGRRDPAATAAHWRARLTPAAFCRRLLAGVGR